jgi:serine/threonine-protein kinase RsbW
MTGVDTATRLRLRLHVPREAARVAAVRRQLDGALAAIGVLSACRDDIVLAVSEACSNAVDHAQTVQEYDVVVTVDRRQCLAEVVDRGPGIAHNNHGGPPGAGTERGRGLFLIRALADHVELRALQPHGLAVRITKILSWAPGMPRSWVSGAYELWTALEP